MAGFETTCIQMPLRLPPNGLGRGRTIPNPQSLPSQSIQDPFDSKVEEYGDPLTKWNLQCLDLCENADDVGRIKVVCRMYHINMKITATPLKTKASFIPLALAPQYPPSPLIFK